MTGISRALRSDKVGSTPSLYPCPRPKQTTKRQTAFGAGANNKNKRLKL